MLCRLHFWIERNRAPFVADRNRTDFVSEQPIPIPRVGDTVHFSGCMPPAGIVVHVDHEFIPQGAERPAMWVTGVYLRCGDGRPSPLDYPS